ncbi:MAG: mucoidy inhibitor MuiA family protein [Anaerolineales bacterium]|nr:mucoidy inhibitor MuiA family protein [Anaerolineales bacterium]
MKIPVETNISDVTVYPDRARVSCRGRCDVTVGAHQLIIEDLPLTLDADSVRVSGAGTAVIRILSVDVHRQFYEETPAAHVRDLEQQIEQLSEERRALEDEKTGWEAHGRFLEGMRQATQEYARGLSRKRTTVEDQAQIVAFLQEQDQGLRTAVRDLDSRLRVLNRQIDKLQKELKAVQSARPRQRYQAVIDVEATADGSFQPVVSYVVNHAGWKPLYDVRLQKDEAGRAFVEVGYMAQVTQDSGQDWDAVKLAVSTARPAINQRLPKLHPWYVDVPRPIRQPERSRSQAKLATVSMSPVAPESMPSPAPMAVDADIAQAAVEDSGSSVRFVVPGTTTIPSDGSPHKSTMQHFRLEPKLDYLAVPKHTDAVFRRATVVNESRTPLLAGAANLFVADEFIGRTKLEFTPVNDEVELLLGVEDRITVERELTRRDVDKRLFGDNRRLRYAYKVTLKNLLETAVSVELHDQIPVGRHEQIKIKLEKAVPEPTEQTDLNLMEWHLTLPVNEEVAVHYEFMVEYPRSMQVMGLP